MSELKVKNLNKKLIQEEDSIPQALFPEIYEIKNLKLDKKLPLLKFCNYRSFQIISKKNIDIDIEVPELKKPVDLLLIVNHRKYDMFYKAVGGIYTFKNVEIDSEENIIEVFYRLGNKKSSSVYYLTNTNKSGNKYEKLARY